MTNSEIAKAVRTHNAAQRQLAAVDAIVKSPGFQQMLKDRNRFGGLFAIQAKVSDLISPELMKQMQEQNKRIGEMLDSSGMRKALLGIDFKLPEAWAEQAAVYWQQFEATAAEAEAETDGGGALKRLAEERDAIIVSLQRISVAMEGFSYLPGSAIPPLIGYLIFVLAVIAEAANEVLSEREDDDK